MTDQRGLTFGVQWAIDTAPLDETQQKQEQIQDESQRTADALEQIGTSIQGIGTRAETAFSGVSGASTGMGTAVRSAMLDSIRHGDNLGKTLRTGLGAALDNAAAKAKGLGAGAKSVFSDITNAIRHPVQAIKATLGTALTEHHVKTLTRFAKRIVYMFDGDAAGQKAARRAIQFIEQDSMDLRCVVLPDGNDPMEFITAHGGEALQARIDAAEPLMDFVYRSLQESSDITTPGGRAKALEDALTLIYPLRDSYMIDTYFIQIADLLGLDLETVRSSSGRVFRDVAKREDAERRREQNYERQRAQAERAGGAGGRASGSQGASHGAWASGVTPSVSTPVEEEPYDCVPLDAYGAAPVEVVDDLPPIYVPDGVGAVPVADGLGAPAAAAPMVLTDLERKSLAGSASC